MDSIGFQNDARQLDEVIDMDYPEISKAIKKEGYNLEYLDFDVFKRIIYEDKVVGFITFKRFPFVDNHFAITDAYVIPEYRGNNILFDQLSLLFLFDNIEFFPKKPTRAFINVLLKNDYAFKLASNFVVSYLKFIVDVDEIYKNPKIKRFYKSSDYPFPYKANLYDMDLCSVMFRDPVLEVIKYSDFFALTEPRKYELKKYKLRKKLKRVSEKYIDDKYSKWDNNSRKIESFMERKDNEFEEKFLVENMIGSEEELVESFADSLKENGMSSEDGFKIRNHIVERIESGELTRTSSFQRVCYLLNHIEDVDKEIGDYDESVEECPFCGEFISDSLRSCLSCGLSIREIDFEEHAVDELNNAMEDLLSDFRDKLQSGIFFEEDNVPIEENDELYDLKVFFNEHMKDYEWEEFLEFYNSSDQSLSIEKIRDAFLDMKLNETMDNEEDMGTYFIYLSHYFFYNLQGDRFDDAFVNLVQLLILASNKSKDKNNILESNPYSFANMLCVDDLLDLNYSFDVSRLFENAVETFKIEKYNNNHDQVLKELKEIFKD